MTRAHDHQHFIVHIYLWYLLHFLLMHATGQSQVNKTLHIAMAAAFICFKLMGYIDVGYGIPVPIQLVAMPLSH
ncbi:MAG: hypothetical protein MJE68_15570, partial [Proteobacteria bacterium]|nr:hypothetical protein [Pseudomonadota bacterium]